MRRKDVNMLSGSITKGLLAIGIPVMIMNVVQSLFNIIDMTTLKTFDTGDGMAVGAVGVCGVLITMITGLVIGVAAGANVIVARNIGRRDPEGIDRAIGASVALALVLSLALVIVGVGGAEIFLRWTNCPEELLEHATLYFRMYFAGTPLLMLYNFCAAIMRANGDSRRPMIYLTTGGAIKVALSFLFVGYFRMGVMGVALSTIVSWSTSLILALWTLMHSNSTVKIRIKNIRFYKQEVKQILKIGVPAGLQQVLYSVANVIISATVNSFGPSATTGMSIANNYDGLTYQFCTATSYAVMPYVSQNIGAGNIKRAVQAVGKGILLTMCLGAPIGALFAIFSGPLASIMSADPVAIAYAQDKMILISSTYFICGFYHVFGDALRGMGKPSAATITTLLYMCLLRFVWVYVCFPLCPNLTFLYLVWPVGWVLSIITLVLVMMSTVKKLKKKYDQIPAPAEN